MTVIDKIAPYKSKQVKGNTVLKNGLIKRYWKNSNLETKYDVLKLIGS